MVRLRKCLRGVIHASILSLELFVWAVPSYSAILGQPVVREASFTGTRLQKVRLITSQNAWWQTAVSYYADENRYYHMILAIEAEKRC